MVYVSDTEVEIVNSAAGEKSHFEKTAFKDMNCDWNLQTQIDKVL